MRAVVLLAVAGRETGQTMTNSRKHHTPEQAVRTLRKADRMLVGGAELEKAPLKLLAEGNFQARAGASPLSLT